MMVDFVKYFIIGLLFGGFLEFIYRSARQKKIITPSFLNMQMYGFAAALLYLLSRSSLDFIYKFFLIFLIPVALEFITGYSHLKIRKKRLWDYRGMPFNVMGIICLEFSCYWFVFAGLYYLVISMVGK